MSTEADFGVYGPVFLAPGQEEWRWFTWIFDRDHWQRMAVTPDSQQSSVQILEEWSDNNINGVTVLWVHWRNIGSTGAICRFKVIVLPNR